MMLARLSEWVRDTQTCNGTGERQVCFAYSGGDKQLCRRNVNTLFPDESSLRFIALKPGEPTFSESVHHCHKTRYRC